MDSAPRIWICEHLCYGALVFCSLALSSSVFQTDKQNKIFRKAEQTRALWGGRAAKLCCVQKHHLGDLVATSPLELGTL